MNVLFFLQPGTISRWIFLDLIKGFERLGHRALVLELEPIWRMYERDQQAKARLVGDMSAVIRSFIQANRIDLSIGTWANALSLVMHGVRDGRPISFFDAIESPHLCFWLDGPQWAHEGSFHSAFRSPILEGRFLHHFINNAATAREMTEVLGFRGVLSRGYGVNEEVFRPYSEQKQEVDLVFACGPGDPAPTPAMLEELESDDPDTGRIRHEAAARVLPELDALAPRFAQGDAAKDLLRALVRTQLEDRHTPVLDRLGALRTVEGGTLAPAIDGLLADPRLFVEVTMKLRTIESFERAFVISYLSRHFSCATFGKHDYKGWGCRARDLGEIRYEDMARAYSAGRIGLNTMRWQDDAGLNVKPYEITASGAPCLCTWRTGLGEQFVDGTEVVSFRTAREAREAARALLDDAGRRRAVGEAGRARTLRDHTWTAWARDMVSGIGAGRAGTGETRTA